MTTDTVIGLSKNFDNFFAKDFDNIGIQEIRSKCSFLVPTTDAQYNVGVTFNKADDHSARLNISVVQQTMHGPRRITLDQVAERYPVLEVYVTVGRIAAQFTQQMISWGDFKIAVVELVGTGEVVE